jgi:hypothetical protein
MKLSMKLLLDANMKVNGPAALKMLSLEAIYLIEIEFYYNQSILTLGALALRAII